MAMSGFRVKDARFRNKGDAFGFRVRILGLRFNSIFNSFTSQPVRIALCRGRDFPCWALAPQQACARQSPASAGGLLLGSGFGFSHFSLGD